MDFTRRRIPLVVILAPDNLRAQATVAAWRRGGAIVARTLDPAGCLRVATATGPDTIVLDRHAPAWLLRLLAAHPVSRRAHIEWLPESVASPARRAA